MQHKQTMRKLNVRVAKVKKMFLSVGKMVDAGNDVVFSKDKSYIKNSKTDTTTEIKREGSVFVLDFEVLGSQVANSKEPSKVLVGPIHSKVPTGQSP